MSEHDKPLSIEQAGNLLKEKEKTLKEDVKADIAKAQISVAPEQDRVTFLLYALCYLNTVSPEVERAFLTITGTISASLTRKQIAELLKKILALRVHGFGIAQIAKHLREPIERIASLEELGKIAVGEAIQKHGLN